MEREIKYGQTLKEDEDGKMIPFYYIRENDDDPPPQYKSPLSSPRHKNKKELIKSSKNLGNKIQNDNLITDEDLEYFVDNTKKLEDFTKKFKDYKSPLSSPRYKNKKELIKSSKNLGNSTQNDNLITDEDLEYFVDNTKKLEDFTKKFKDYKSPLSSPRYKNKKELIKSSKNLGNSTQNDNLITDKDLEFFSPEEIKDFTKKFKDNFISQEAKYSTHKELIKSSKNLGNKIQNDNNISHLDIGMSQIEQEIFEFNSNDFKNIQIFKPFIHKIKCLNTRINTYIKLTLDFEICNVYDVKNGGECINQTFFTDEVIIRIFDKVYYTNNPKFFNFKGNIEVTPHFFSTTNVRNFPFIFASSAAGIQYNTYYSSSIKNHNELKSFDDKSSPNNLINIDDDLLFFNLQFVVAHPFYQNALAGSPNKVDDVYLDDENLKYNFEKSKIICKVLKEIK